MEWIADNWDNLLLVLTGAVTLAAAITKLTPNKKDDEVVGWFRKVLEKVALR